MKALLLLVMLNLMSLASQAMTPFEEHFKAVSQGMSAFYMYELSKGDDRFLQEFDQYNKLASQALAGDKLAANVKLQVHWQTLKPQLVFTKDDLEGFSFVGAVRKEYRDYLVDLFLRFDQQEKKEGSVDEAFTRVQIFNSLLAARALDVASSLWGERAFLDHDKLLNQKIVAQKIEKDIQMLLKEELNASQLRSLRKVSSKFQFMKKSLIDYQAETAYFLMYRSVISINKLMANSQVM